jgi:hypothetical protein
MTSPSHFNARRREAAAERDQRRKMRRRAGRIVVPIEIHLDDIDVLVEQRRLGEWDERNRELIGRAIEELVAEYVVATRGDAD